MVIEGTGLIHTNSVVRLFSNG